MSICRNPNCKSCMTKEVRTPMNRRRVVGIDLAAINSDRTQIFALVHGTNSIRILTPRTCVDYATYQLTPPLIKDIQLADRVIVTHRQRSQEIRDFELKVLKVRRHKS